MKSFSGKRLAPCVLLLAGSMALAQETTAPAAPGQTTTITTPSAPLSKSEMKAQKKQQKLQEKAAKESAKAQKDSASALKHQDKATDAEEKVSPTPATATSPRPQL
jgi:hypothetical protein